MLGKTAAILLSTFFASLILVNPVYASSFNDYESASFLAKIPEVKVETEMIATHPGDKDAINYYVNILNKYWTPTDRKNLHDRNPQLEQDISLSINDSIVQAEAGNGDKAYSDFFTIAGDMEQAGLVRVDPIPSSNTTIIAMSVALVLKESLARYGDAIGSSQLSDLSLQGTSQSGIGSDGPQRIVNEYAYENSKELAQESYQMFGQLVTHVYQEQAYNDNADKFMQKYISDINSKVDASTVTADVYNGVLPNFVTGYKLDLQSVPEFPFPAVMASAMMFLAIAVTRFGLKK